MLIERDSGRVRRCARGHVAFEPACEPRAGLERATAEQQRLAGQAIAQRDRVLIVEAKRDARQAFRHLVRRAAVSDEQVDGPLQVERHQLGARIADPCRAFERRVGHRGTPGARQCSPATARAPDTATSVRSR